MAKKDNTAIAWAVGLGTLVLAGVGIVFYEKSQAAASSSGGSTQTTTTTNPTTSPTGVADPIAAVMAQPAGNTTAQQATQKALVLFKLGQKTAGATWVATARANNPTPLQLAALTAAGY